MNSRTFPIFPSASTARVLAALWLAGYAASGASAQPSPTVSSERPANLPSLGGAQDSIWGSQSSYDGLSPHIGTPAKGPFFLPALLPVLGTPPAPGRAPLAPNYPRESAGEPFFMAEGNLAANNLLSDKRADHLASYRTARLTLLTELRAELEHSQAVPAADRPRVLAEIAALQTPRLLELEAEAEQIRYDLTHVEALKITADDIGKLAPRDEESTYLGPFASPTFRLGRRVMTKQDPKFNAERAALRMVLSAAHFRDGFSPDQRRLLEEMAQELVLTIEPESGPASVFFWPAGARIPAPAGLAPAMAAKFEEFQRRKAALKNELRAVLDRERKHIFNFEDTEAFVALAAAQAPRFAELDALADEVRPALAGLADASDLLAVDLPADLAHQITYFVERKAVLQRELRSRLVEFRSKLPADRIELVRQGEGLVLTVATTSDTPSDRELVLTRLKDFNEDISARFAALAVVSDRVRTGLARYQATASGAKAGLTVDQLAADFLAAYNTREYRQRQSDYAAAVFTPGLSPAQRRLLLAAAAVNSLQDKRPRSLPLSP